MFYKIFVLLLTLFLSSCYINDNKNICKDDNIDFIKGDELSFINICNYKEKLKNLILKNNSFNINEFYILSKIDIDSGEYILGNIDNNMSEIQKIQLYYILKEIYNYNDENIENKLGPIETKYKNLGVSTERIISAENLFTQVFEGQEETINGIQNASGNLSYNDLEFLNIIFTLEPERFNNINLVTDLMGGYNVLKDEQSRKLYIDIMKHLLDTVNNNQSKEMIHIFLIS
ncbi:MAG: hypothetical protein AB7E37_02545 [Candidatus Altimarinota bacterium]